MIKFYLDGMNAVQLAMLYKLLVRLHRLDDADLVYNAGVANCGERDFCYEVAKQGD